MSEKVLGFEFIHANRKDGDCAVVWFDERNVKKLMNPLLKVELPAVYCDQFSFKKVSVRLASESVDLKKLKEYRKSYIKDNQYIEGGLVSTILDDLIEWVEKEVKK